MSEPELQSFRDVYEFLDLQRQSVDLRTFEEHIRRAASLVESGACDIGQPAQRGAVN